MIKWGMALLLVACVPVFAASFDCTKARTPQEKAICASPELSQLDDELGAAYQALLEIAPPEYAATVREDQHAWLAERSTTCGPKLDQQKMLSCLKDEYSSRIPELHVDTKEKGGVLFVWRAIVRTVPDTPGELTRDVNEVNPGFGTLEASWPQASMATPEWRAWNRAMEDATRAVTQSISNGNTTTGKWYAQANTDTEASVRVNSVSDNLVTASIFVLVDFHGAHPNHGSSEFNWLLKEKRTLGPDDVFAVSSGWQAWFQDRIDKYLHARLDPTQDDGDYRKFLPEGGAIDALRRIASDVSRWRLDEHGLTIDFQPYEMACYACTPQPLTITWKDLKPYLNPRFQIPR